MTLSAPSPYKRFLKAFSQAIQQHPDIANPMLSNIFSLREVGNKAHGDWAEVIVAHFIDRYVPQYKGLHVGKDRFRSKKGEEDIEVVTPKDIKLDVSLKAYGSGPLQLSTDKNGNLFPFLERQTNSQHITDSQKVQQILQHPDFTPSREQNVLPLIYDENQMRADIKRFDHQQAFSAANRIRYLDEQSSKRRKHPVYRFFKDDQYIMEVRYGAKASNALQRGLWTHTRKAQQFFTSLIGGWRSYQINNALLQLLPQIMMENSTTHRRLLNTLKQNHSVRAQRSPNKTSGGRTVSP